MSQTNVLQLVISQKVGAGYSFQRAAKSLTLLFDEMIEEPGSKLIKVRSGATCAGTRCRNQGDVDGVRSSTLLTGLKILW